VAKEGEADGRGSQQRAGQQDGGNAVPVNWRGARAPPRPVRTNIRMSENAVARS